MVILSIQDFSIFPSHSSWHELESQSVDQWCQYLVSSFEADRAQALEHEANSANGSNRATVAPPSPWRKITVLDPLPDLAIRFSTMYAYSLGHTKPASAESTAANSPTKFQQ
ncbi:hypothetical protein BCR44DRAFT_1285410 [Catenaria anguillulae PL171]|uniref:Uncharacterized protein n=1 Tax=Catenaria anguillulae PL171 TaxID=765915 RepID=A0A1Y2HZ55_9FUNG|nr:hypothetical protein BCR44DRAFT_1285410 [Catenaria anguillulae PL171]